jgi:hypothetical protein
MSDKAAISQAIGSLSNGPRTSEGKERSSRNSLKHGLTSESIVLAHESREEFDDLEASYLDVYRPVGAVEIDLVREMVLQLLQSDRAASECSVESIEELESELQNEPSDLETEAFVEAYLRPPAQYHGYIADRLASFEEHSRPQAA